MGTAIALAAVTYFNNYVLNNTDLVGSFLPLGVVALFAVLAGVNAVLLKFAPSRALRTPELATILAMSLVACAVPAGGLMRYLPGNLIGLPVAAGESEDLRVAWEALHLPAWLMPQVQGDGLTERLQSPVVVDFLRPSGTEGSSFVDTVRNVPWGAWVRPAACWSLFLMCVGGAVLCLSIILRRQWAENERLPFPLATVLGAMIETPPPGRLFNTTIGSRPFLIAFAAVLALHVLRGLDIATHGAVPSVALRFDLTRVLTESSWNAAEPAFKSATIYFTMVGMVFFISTHVALSMWACFVGVQLLRIYYAADGRELSGGMQMDQLFGGMIVYAAAAFWVGRQFYGSVVRRMFRSGGRDADAPRFLSNAAAGWGFVACSSGALAWMVAAGMSVGGALLVGAMLLLVIVVLTRVVAETGLLYVFLPVPLNRPFVYLLQDLPGGLAVRTTTRSFFFGAFFSGVLTHDLRQSLPVYATHALQVAAGNAGDGPAHGRRQEGRRLLVAMAIALMLATVVSAAVTLYTQYTFRFTMDRYADVVNEWGNRHMARWVILPAVADYSRPSGPPADAHSHVAHVGAGMAVTAAMSALRLRFVAWPLHPVGFLMAYTAGMRWMWFSIVLGWAFKSLVVRAGGAGAYTFGKQVALGMIFGESIAAMAWLVTTCVLALLGVDYTAINVLPT